MGRPFAGAAPFFLERDMPRVMYVGRKAKKEDNVAGSGVVWMGHGDIQPVSNEAWAKLAAYPDVWVDVPDEPAPEPEAPAPSGGLSDAAPEAVDLYNMNTAALREYAIGKGYRVDLSLKAKDLRTAIQAIEAA
jgi:hypothetical protein